MKKVITVFSAIFMVVAFSTGICAMEFMAGAKAGYYAWQPFYKDVGGSGMSDIKWGDGILYGPIVSFIFTPELSLSVAGLMGSQSTHWQSEFSDFEGNPDISITGNYSFDVFRADFDSVLSYRALENVRLFAGYKYLYMKVDMNYTELRTDNTLNNDIDEINVSSGSYNSYFHGPALGVGYAHPFSQYYFAAITVSGVYMWGNFSMNNSTGHNWSGSNYSGPRKNAMTDTSMRQIGLNIEPSIGFSPGKGMPIITLGFRYQRFWVQFTENTSGPDRLPSKWLDDTMLGIFMSAVFMF